MRYLLIGLGCYLCHLVHAVVLPAAFGGAFGLLPLAAVVIVGLYAGPWAGGIAGLCLGLAAEAMSAIPTLTYLLPLTFAGVAVGFFSGRAAWRQLAAGCTAIVLALTAVHLVLGWTVALGGGDFGLGRALWAAVLPDIGWTLAFFLAAFGLRLAIERMKDWRRIQGLPK